MSHPSLFDDGKANAWQQQMDLMKACLEMLSAATPEWLHFLELVKEMRDAQRYAEFGVAHSKIKRDRAERAVDVILQEFAEVAKPIPGGMLDFTRTTNDHAATESGEDATP